MVYISFYIFLKSIVLKYLNKFSIFCPSNVIHLNFLYLIETFINNNNDLICT